MKKQINIKKQSGFTLMEMLIVLGILTLIMVMIAPLLGRLIDFSSDIESETNLQSLGNAVSSWYEENAWDIDLQEDSSLPFYGNTMSNNTSTLSNNAWKTLVLTYNNSNNSLYDGYNHAYRIFVSNRLEQMYNGVLIPYHNIAIVTSNGDNVDSSGTTVVESTFNQQTGELNLAQGESGYVVSGYNIQKNKFERSKQRLETIAKAYEDYYWSRFTTRGREPAINYFAKKEGDSRWDRDVQGNTTSVVDTCQNLGTSLVLSNGRRALGYNIFSSGLVDELRLSDNSVKSEWGRDFRILNCGSTSNTQVGGATTTFSTRTPESGNTPPYTAVLGFTLPNSETYSQTITSQF